MDVALADSFVHAKPFIDGFGERRVIIDARGDCLDVFRVKASLATVPSFEAALRERVTRVAGFQHPAYSPVQSVEVERSSGTLTIVSDHVQGARLSTLLAAAEKRSTPVDVPASGCIVRQLVLATTAWHEQMPDVVHGAIAPERLIVTPNGRLVVADYVLGSALEQLRYSRQQYWEELRVALPATFKFAINARADVLQVGLVALALLLGRRLTASDRLEIPTDLRDSLPDPLRMWLLRALQLEPVGSFTSVLDARAGLDSAFGVEDSVAEQDALSLFMARCLALNVETPQLRGDDERDASGKADDLPDVDIGMRIEALRTFLARRSERREARAREEPPHEAPEVVQSGPSVMPSTPSVMPSTPSVVPNTPSVVPNTPSVVPNTPSVVPSTPDVVPNTPSVVPSTPDVGTNRLDDMPGIVEVEPSMTNPPAEAEPSRRADVPSDPEIAPALVASTEREAPRRVKMPALPEDWTRRLWIAAAAVLVIGAALIMLVAGVFPWSRQPSTGALSIETRPAGVAVTVDGTPRGVTPLAIELEAGDHVIELVSNGDRRRVPVTIRAGAEISQFLEMKGDAVATPTELRIRTEPLGAEVTVDGQYVGRSPVSVGDLAPGPHTVVLKHASGTATEQVLIEAGKSASLFVPLAAAPPVTAAGWISVPSPIDVQLFENGRLIGSSSVERIMLSAGRHDLEFANEVLGFSQRQTVQVTPGQVSTIKLAWPTGRLAINAVPWAEAFVDGRSVGETPIGNVQVPIGPHQVVLRHPQLGERTISVTVTTRETAKVGIDLRTK